MGNENVFDESEDIAGSGEDTELDEVDATSDTDDDETEEVDSDDKPKAKKAGGAKKKANARPPVPEGFIAPVAFAKKLTAKLVEDGKLSDDEEIPPQMIYSYIKNTAKGKDPLPTYEAGGRQNLLKEEEAFAWWARKDARAAERVANKGKKAEKAEKSDVEEAEGSEPEAADVE